MKREFIFLCASFACVMLLAGCLAPTTTKTRVKAVDSGRRGVEVIVNEDGTLLLYGNPIDREKLVERLIDDESADRGRAVELKAKGDVRRKQLVELRDYLVAHKIPNVVVVTQRNAVSYESGAKSLQPSKPDGAVRGPGPVRTPPRKTVGGSAPAAAP